MKFIIATIAVLAAFAAFGASAPAGSQESVSWCYPCPL